jgi:hypothetical protein
MEVFNLNIRPGKTCPVIHCSQFDKGRTFRANLYDGSEVFTLTAAETLSVIEKKSDGNMVTIGVTNTSDSYVEFATTEQMTALAGPQICELRIVEGDTLIGSANFILDCEESPDTGIESESEIHNLETQIQDINNEIVPDMVAEEVENQYDSQNVIFDDAPTENHGTGYAVTSEGVKNALDGKPDNLSDLGDVNISSPTSKQALVYNPTTQKWENAMIPQTGTIEDVAIASFSDGADDVPVSSLIVDIEARQEGSGTPSPDNVRPITGFSSAKVSRTGKNLMPYPYADTTKTVGGLTFTDNGDGTITANGTTNSTAIFILHNSTTWIPLPKGTYTLSGCPAGGGQNIYRIHAQLQPTPAQDFGNSATFLETDMAKLTTGAIYIAIAPGVTVNNLVFKPQIEYGSTATTYEPYNGNTYTVAFGQTVYGGSYDANSGKVSLTWFSYLAKDMNWVLGNRNYANTGRIFFCRFTTNIPKNRANCLCDILKNATTYQARWENMDVNEMQIDNAQNVVICVDVDTVAELKTLFGDSVLTYELATPIEIQLTPVQVKTLLGNNNIFADTGNIEKLVYFKTGCENIAKLIEAAPNLASVQSVNGRTGAVELDAFNIPYDSENSIAEKIDENTQAIDEAIEAISSADFTFTPASGVTASSVTACKNDKLCIFAAEIRFTGNANAWTVLGTVDVTLAVSHVLSAGVNTSNGSYLGMVEVRQDGTVRIYPTSNVSNGYVMFSLNFKTT